MSDPEEFLAKVTREAKLAHGCDDPCPSFDRAIRVAWLVGALGEVGHARMHKRADLLRELEKEANG